VPKDHEVLDEEIAVVMLEEIVEQRHYDSAHQLKVEPCLLFVMLWENLGQCWPMELLVVVRVVLVVCASIPILSPNCESNFG